MKIGYGPNRIFYRVLAIVLFYFVCHYAGTEMIFISTLKIFN